MEKKFTLFYSTPSVVHYEKDIKGNVGECCELSVEAIQNILNFSKALQVRKSDVLKQVEIVLN
ncbi:MAG TPA: hypothetical protein VII99_10160 [Bacteroidia bacterium]